MIVIDASALLAYVYGEPGAETVEAALSTSVIHAVNFAEVLSRLAERGSSLEGANAPQAGPWARWCRRVNGS